MHLSFRCSRETRDAHPSPSASAATPAFFGPRSSLRTVHQVFRTDTIPSVVVAACEHFLFFKTSQPVRSPIQTPISYPHELLRTPKSSLKQLFLRCAPKCLACGSQICRVCSLAMITLSWRFPGIFCVAHVLTVIRNWCGLLFGR